MLEFAEWSLQRQKQFWLRLARDLIGNWNLSAPKLSWLGYGSNAVFKVNANEGDFVLRLQTHGRLDADSLRAELAWLRHIADNTDLAAPAPLPTNDASAEEFFAQVLTSALPPPSQVYACLFRFIAGEPKSSAQLTIDDMRRIGEYLARLHSAGQFEPPQGFSRPRLDWSGFFGANSPYHFVDDTGLISPVQTKILSQVLRRVRGAMKKLGDNADTFGLIHGDLLAKNILFEHSQPAALDFEYCGWGYFLYDLAPLLWQLKSLRAADYQRLETALWSGYASLRPQIDGHRRLLEDFIAARQWASLRWLLGNLQHPTIRDQARSLIAARAQELKSYLDEGILRRSTPTL